MIFSLLKLVSLNKKTAGINAYGSVHFDMDRFKPAGATRQTLLLFAPQKKNLS
jgi:hypothetical protein